LWLERLLELGWVLKRELELCLGLEVGRELGRELRLGLECGLERGLELGMRVGLLGLGLLGLLKLWRGLLELGRGLRAAGGSQLRPRRGRGACGCVGRGRGRRAIRRVRVGLRLLLHGGIVHWRWLAWRMRLLLRLLLLLLRKTASAIDPGGRPRLGRRDGLCDGAFADGGVEDLAEA